MDSKRVLDIFKEITRIPRESGHEEQIIAYLQNFANERSLECRTDEVGNVLIAKKASQGFEHVPALVLQGHSDMVCEKNSGIQHDFAVDPIHYIIEGGWMIAPDTTLGADCGIGMAAQLAVLESDIPSGRIECLFTVAEETGLDGAKALTSDFITGKTLINLDSEDEGEFFIGCAGGLDTTARFKCAVESIDNDCSLVSFKIFNAAGGHSGDDIDKGRANAVQLLSRFLYGILDYGFRIHEINGGNKRNAIAREAYCSIALPKVKVSEAIKEFESFARDVKSEYPASEPKLSFQCSPADGDCQGKEVVSQEDTYRIITSLFVAPHGVLAMSQEIKGLVETSSNLASVKMTGNIVRIGTSQRSALDSARKMAGAKVEACFRLAGAEVSHESEYPGWRPSLQSNILNICKDSYKRLFGVEPVVRAIHAGLECGLFLDKYPSIDMISFGPTLRGVHAPGERLDLQSLDKFVLLLEDVIKNFR